MTIARLRLICQIMVDLIWSTLSLWDITAVAATLLAWAVIGWLIEHPPKDHPSVTRLVAEYRRDWMLVFMDRSPRIFDAQILNGLRQGTSFFASTGILAIGGLMALIGNPGPLQSVNAALELDPGSALLWQTKLGFVMFFVVMAFLRFVWANRLFGYCSIIMASVPNDQTAPHALSRAKLAGEINIRAAMNFNRGLRGMYFALAALGWLVHPWVLLGACALTLWTLYSREFQSLSRQLMAERADDD